ncbi:TPA: hypothetical protein ACKRWH_001282 [Providencia rettgeri]|uniref:hypothetical protein n=1 Tax=Providencia TaxID=586 RepID=UPI002B4C18F3|nr:hypothetical protein [Providencia rettgeri]
MKKYHARHEALLRHYQHWLDGFTKLAVFQEMCHYLIKNSRQLMVADIRFPDNDSTPTVVPVCLIPLNTR